MSGDRKALLAAAIDALTRAAEACAAAGVPTGAWSGAAHSTETGRSEVAADATTTRSARGSDGRHTTVRPTTRPSGQAARAALRWSSSVRVSSTGARPGPSSSSRTMAAHCSGVLPGPYTSSARPWRSSR